MTKILVLTTEPLPFPGFIATGAGLRAWGLARGLEAAGLSVEIAMPDDHLAALEPERRAEVEEHCFSRARLTEFARSREPDVIVMQHWGMMRELGEVDCPLAIDLAGPHLLERRFWGSPNLEGDRAEKLEALSRADYVTCSGRSQRLYFLPFLEAAGFDVSDSALCPVIPFSVDPHFPEEAERDAATFVYGGMFLPWQDPAKPLGALLDAFDSAGRGRLRFYGGPHPTLDVSQGRFDALVERLKEHASVEMCGLKAYDDLVADYCRAGVALDVMARNAERELAFPTRTVVYLWCGLPVIHSDYTDLAPYIERYDAGWTVAPEDGQALRDVATSILSKPELVEEKGRNARRLVTEEFRWDKTIAPLAEWCRDPQLREDKHATALREVLRDRRAGELEDELAATRHELDTLRGKLIFRLAQKRRLWGPILAPFAFLGACLASLILLPALWLTRARNR